MALFGVMRVSKASPLALGIPAFDASGLQPDTKKDHTNHVEGTDDKKKALFIGSFSRLDYEVIDEQWRDASPGWLYEIDICRYFSLVVGELDEAVEALWIPGACSTSLQAQFLENLLNPFFISQG